MNTKEIQESAVYLAVFRFPLFLFLFLFLPAALNAQSGQAYIDSLQNVVRTSAVRDSNYAIALYRLCFSYSKIDFDSAEKYGEDALRLSMELNFQKGIGASYNNLGLLYEKQGEDVKALKYYTLSLDAKRKAGDPKSIASTLNNIGVIYKKQEYFTKAIEYYREAIAINRESGNREFLLINYYNTANCFKGLHNGDSALYYYEIGAALSLEINQYTDYANILHAKGNYYIDIGDYQRGMQLVDSSRQVVIQHQVRFANYLYYEARGRAFFGLGNLDSAEANLMKSWLEKKDTRDWGPMSYSSRILSDLYIHRYKTTHDTTYYGKAYRFLMFSYSTRDSLLSVKRMNTIFELVTEDLIKQKNAEIFAIQREKELVDLKADNERLFRNFMIAIAIAVCLVLFVLWLRFKKSQALTKLLGEQKTEIEIKNKEIIDSITYAKRLQDAILPPVSLMRQFFPEAFVLYLPKDIVAGDFYWAESAGDNFYIAAADCTGHGVPGAMVSVVCANALERTVKEFAIRDTGKILDKTRDLVLHTFVKGEEMVNDGMDISLVSISINPNSPGKIQWSGANNPLWIVSNGELTELKPDKQPIGRFEHSRTFTTHDATVNKGTMLYLLTDGYADQFGGPKGKKFKYAQLQKLLVEISSETAVKQHEILAKKITEWRGNLEQIDDICIVGIKL